MKFDVTAHHTYQSIRAQERDIVAEAQRGSEAAMRILLQAHRPAIFRVAQRYVAIARGLGFADKFRIEDAFAYANFGYCRGIRKFDLARTTKLITYALHWSHHECERAMRDALGDIRVPVWAQKEGYRPVKALRLDSPVRMSNGFTSDETLGESVPDAEALSPEDQIDARRRAEKLRAVYVEVLSSLNERERELVLVRLSRHERDRMTLEAIGAKWGMTRERVRQIENHTKTKVRLLMTRLGAKRLAEAA